MIESIIREFAKMKLLWERGKLDRLDWDDFEWIIEQAGVEYASLLTHVRHVEQEAEASEAVLGEVSGLRDHIDILQGDLTAEKMQHREQMIQAASREQQLHQQMGELRAELKRAREEAELIVRNSRGDAPLFDGEGEEEDV